MNIYIDDKIVFENADWEMLNPIQYKFSEKQDADVLCVGIKREIDNDYIKYFSNLKYILSPSTGLTHIKDIKKDIKIINLIPDEVKEISASSEFVVLLTLSILRRINEILYGRGDIIGEDIRGKTIGILGYGRIGKNIDNIFSSMGAKIIWHDINRDSLSKKYILEESDIIIVLVSCTKENANYIDYQDFLCMRKNPYFINVTRGFVVNEFALLDALVTKKIKGASLDVVEDLYLFRDYLRDNYNLIITPHVAGSTFQSHKKACDYVIEKLKNEITQNYKH